MWVVGFEPAASRERGSGAQSDDRVTQCHLLKVQQRRELRGRGC